MARKHPDRQRQVTVNLDEDDSAFLDQLVFSLGLDGRNAAALTLIRMGRSMVPQDTMVFETCRQAVHQTRKHLFGSIAEFLAGLSRDYKEGTK